MGPVSRRLFTEARQEGNIAVSAMTIWEVGMRVQKGHLHLRRDLNAWRQELQDLGVVELPVDGAIAARASLLPDMHGDPADRIIVATAIGGHELMTADRGILAWPGELSRLDASK